MAIQLTAAQTNVQAQAIDFGDQAKAARARDAAATVTPTIEAPRDVVVGGTTVNEIEAVRASLVATGSDAASTIRAKDASGEGHQVRIGAMARLSTESTVVQGGAKTSA